MCNSPVIGASLCWENITLVPPCNYCHCCNNLSLFDFVQGQLHRTQASLQEWHNTFQSIAANAGLPVEPATLLMHLQQTHQQPAATVTAGSTATEDISVLRQRESQLQAQLMEKILENMELRRHLHAAKAAAEPNVVQVSHAVAYLPLQGGTALFSQ